MKLNLGYFGKNVLNKDKEMVGVVVGYNAEINSYIFNIKDGAITDYSWGELNNEDKIIFNLCGAEDNRYMYILENGINDNYHVDIDGEGYIDNDDIVSDLAKYFKGSMVYNAYGDADVGLLIGYSLDYDYKHYALILGITDTDSVYYQTGYFQKGNYATENDVLFVDKDVFTKYYDICMLHRYYIEVNVEEDRIDYRAEDKSEYNFEARLGEKYHMGGLRGNIIGFNKNKEKLIVGLYPTKQSKQEGFPESELDIDNGDIYTANSFKLFHYIYVNEPTDDWMGNSFDGSDTNIDSTEPISDTQCDYQTTYDNAKLGLYNNMLNRYIEDFKSADFIEKGHIQQVINNILNDIRDISHRK